MTNCKHDQQTVDRCNKEQDILCCCKKEMLFLSNDARREALNKELNRTNDYAEKLRSSLKELDK